MAFYLVNTDWNARDDVVTCDLWFQHNMAFAGDHVGRKWDHSTLYRRLTIGDILFMYHSKRDNKKHGKKGFVGIGEVLEDWGEVSYEGSDRILYREEPHEYRIPVKWFADWRDSPKNAKELSLFTTPASWATIDEKKYPVRELVRESINSQLAKDIL